MGLTSEFTWQLYIVIQYVAMFGVLGWWIYKKRIARGFKVLFVAVASGENKGSYEIDERRFEKLAKSREFRKGDKVVVRKAVECIHEFAPSEVVQFLHAKEVKSGQEFVEYKDKAFMIPWEHISHREFGWEYMVVDISNFKSLTFGGETVHYYSAVDAGTILGGKLFSKAFDEKQAGDYKVVIILAVMFTAMLAVMATYFVTVYIVQSWYEGWVPAQFVGGILKCLF